MIYNPEWAAIIANPPKRRNGRAIGTRKINGKWVQTNEGPSQTTQCKNAPKKVKAAGQQHRGSVHGNTGKANGKMGGRPKGSRNSAETIAKQSASIAAQSWRHHSPNKGSASLQSGSGFAGEADYSIHAPGQVFAHRQLLDEGWS